MNNISQISQNTLFSTKYISKQNQNHKKNYNNTILQTNTKAKLITPNASQILAFCGGKSLDLALTYNQIKTFGAFPPDIEENIKKELENQNPRNKTLIDIHREKYDFLNQMDSLEEVKLFFPEFSEVLSDDEVKYSKNSFIDNVKSGKLEYFDPDKDIALQLLQMYWGDGFSINDLKNNFANVNLENTFKKLNIPNLNSTYAHYLKLSDKKYNERFSALQSEKLKGKKKNSTKRQKTGQNINPEEKTQTKEKTQRKPLSEEHKRKISQGLIEYYKQNPQRAAEISEENLKRYKTQEEKEIFSQIMVRAWNYGDCKPVKKAMSKFMKRNIEDEEIEQLTQENSDLRKNLSGFYKKNPWAKAQLSKAMKKSWERQRELNELGLNFEPLTKVKLIPTQVAQELEKSTKTSGLAKNIQYYYLPDERDLKNLDGEFLICTAGQENKAKAEEFFKQNKDFSSQIADVLLGAIVDNYLNLYLDAQENNNFDIKFKEMDKLIYNNLLLRLQEEPQTPMKTNQLQDIYNKMAIIACYKHENYKQINRMNTLLDEAYKDCSKLGVSKYFLQTQKLIEKSIELHDEYEKKLRSCALFNDSAT